MALTPAEAPDAIDDGPSSQSRRPALRIFLIAGVSIGLAAAAAMGLWVARPSLIVESQPGGARVFLDDAEVGLTPLELRFWAPASWRVRVERAGYASWAEPAIAALGETTHLIAVLAPLPGTLFLSAEPDGTQLLLDDAEVGQAPIQLASVPAGTHRLAATAPNYQPGEVTFEMPPGGRVEQHIALMPIPARLSLLTEVESAIVLVDGEPRGPASEPIEIEPGAHAVRVEAAGYRPWEWSLDLAPNESRSLDISVQREWPDLENGDSVMPLAVIVENQEQARPQSGLAEADVVYEALAEGGITRFLALYATRTPEVVGPVRSARHYFVHWAREYSAALVHIGGSPQAYAVLNDGRTRSLDAGHGGGVFWRAADRPAPHNAFTSIAGSIGSIGEAGAGSFGGLHFRKGGLRLSGERVPGVTVKYGPWSHSVIWSYEPDRNEYSRVTDGKPDVDVASGEPIRAKNVLVLRMDAWPIAGDNGGRLELAQVGQGDLLALMDGVAIEGHWSRPSLTAATEYVDSAGEPIQLNAGATWIHAVPANGRVDR